VERVGPELHCLYLRLHCERRSGSAVLRDELHVVVVVHAAELC
jgi:hypothetical protein